MMMMMMKVWQDCSSSKCTSINKVGCLIQCHTFKMVLRKLLLPSGECICSVCPAPCCIHPSNTVPDQLYLCTCFKSVCSSNSVQGSSKLFSEFLHVCDMIMTINCGTNSAFSGSLSLVAMCVSVSYKESRALNDTSSQSCRMSLTIHNVTWHLTQVNTSHLNPSQNFWLWLRWDGITANRWSPIQELSSTNPAVHGWELNSHSVDHKSSTVSS